MTIRDATSTLLQFWIAEDTGIYRKKGFRIGPLTSRVSVQKLKQNRSVLFTAMIMHHKRVDLSLCVNFLRVL